MCFPSRYVIESVDVNEGKCDVAESYFDGFGFKASGVFFSECKLSLLLGEMMREENQSVQGG